MDKKYQIVEKLLLGMSVNLLNDGSGWRLSLVSSESILTLGSVFSGTFFGSKNAIK